MTKTGKDSVRTVGNVSATGKTSLPKTADAADGRDVGTALRTAYQATVEETIPAEMLDLLGKLN